MLLSTIGLAVFVIFIFTQRWFELTLQVRFYQIFTVSLSLFFILVGSLGREYLNSRLTIIDGSWFIGISVIIVNIFRVGYSDNLSPLFFYSASLLFLVITKIDIKAYGFALMLVKYGGLVYATGTIVQYLYTETFNSFIFNYTISSSQDSINSLTRGNYYPGFGFGQTSVTTGYTSMALGYIWTFWDKNKPALMKCFDATLFGIILFGLVVVGRRIPLIFAIASLLITYIIISQGKEKWKRILIVIFAAFILLSGVVILFQAVDVPQFLVRYERMVSDFLAGNIPSSMQVRLDLYEQAWVLFNENRLTGIGWFEFQYLNRGEHHVHNTPLQLLAELGLIGFVAVLVPVIYVYYITLKAYNRAFLYAGAIDSMWCKGLAYSIFYQTFFLLNSLLDTIFFHIVFVLMYFVSISIVNSFIVFERNSKPY